MCVFGQRCCVCVCCDERGRGSWLSLGNIKTHTHTRSHAGLHLAAQSHLTGLICGPPTSLSLPHSSTVLCSLSLSQTLNLARSLSLLLTLMPEIRPLQGSYRPHHCMLLGEGGHRRISRPPTPPGPTPPPLHLLLHLHLRCTEKENASIE